MAYRKDPTYGAPGYDDTQALPYTPPFVIPACPLPAVPTLKTSDTFTLAGPPYEYVVDYTTFVDVGSIPACSFGEITVEIHDQNPFSGMIGFGMGGTTTFMREDGMPTPLISCLASELGLPANQETFTCAEAGQTIKRWVVLREPNGNYGTLANGYGLAESIPEALGGGTYISGVQLSIAIDSDYVNCPPVVIPAYTMAGYIKQDETIKTNRVLFPEGQTTCIWQLSGGNLVQITGLPFFGIANLDPGTITAFAFRLLGQGWDMDNTSPYQVTVNANACYASPKFSGGVVTTLTEAEGLTLRVTTAAHGTISGDVYFGTDDSINRDPRHDVSGYDPHAEGLCYASTAGAIVIDTDGSSGTGVAVGDGNSPIGYVKDGSQIFFYDYKAGVYYPQGATLDLGYPGGPGYASGYTLEAANAAYIEIDRACTDPYWNSYFYTMILYPNLHQQLDWRRNFLDMFIFNNPGVPIVSEDQVLPLWLRSGTMIWEVRQLSTSPTLRFCP